MLALDVETTGLDWWSPDFRVFMAQWSDGQGDRGYCTEDDGWDALHAVLRRHNLLVGANFGFDIHCLRAAGIVDLTTSGHRLHDVQILARVAIPGRFSYKLEQLGTDILGADSTVQQRALAAAAKAHDIPWTLKNKDYYALWKAEPELLAQYGLEDVDLTIALWDRIWHRVSKSDADVYRFEIRQVAPALRAAEADGVLKDMGRVAALKLRLLNERDEFRELCLSGGLSEEALGELQPIDPEDPDAEPTYGKASSKALLADLLAVGVPLYKLTKSSGKPKKDAKAEGGFKRDATTGEVVLNPDRLAVDKDALNEFVEAYPVVKHLMEWRTRNLTLRTYIGALEQPGARVHTSMNQVQARTSRMSSSRPNMQNLPTTEGVRDVLVPAPGNSFIVADFDSIEVRVLAHGIGNPELIALLESGVDMHQQTAYKVALSRGEKCALEDFVKGGPRDKDRTIAKVTTFTAMYGGGARLIGVRLGISTMEAAAIKQATLDAVPGYARFDERCKAAVRARSFPHVRTLLGRRLWTPKDKPYVSLNTWVQGNSAEIMKLALVAATPVMAAYDYRLRLVVHDELVAEGPTGCVEEALSATIEAMENCYPLRPRLVVSGGHSSSSYGGAK